MSEINWGGLNVGGRETYPENLYHVEIQKWEKVVASTGTDQVRWYATILDTDKMDNNGDSLEGKSLIEHTPLSDAAFWKIGWFVNTCGINLKSLPKMQTGSEAFARVLNHCVGRKMYWAVIVDVFNGKKNNKVDQYIPDDEQDPIEELDLEAEIPDFIK